MPEQQPIYLVLINVRSAYNVGSIFRTADAAGITKIYLCGITPTPRHPKVAKTALGAHETLTWEYFKQAGRLLKKLNKNTMLVALEQTPESIDYRRLKLKGPTTIIVGHERQGLSKKILEKTAVTVEIPMRGQKESLNVAVATGIMLYEATRNRK